MGKKDKKDKKKKKKSEDDDDEGGEEEQDEVEGSDNKSSKSSKSSSSSSSSGDSDGGKSKKTKKTKKTEKTEKGDDDVSEGSPVKTATRKSKRTTVAGDDGGEGSGAVGGYEPPKEPYDDTMANLLKPMVAKEAGPYVGFESFLNFQTSKRVTSFKSSILMTDDFFVPDPVEKDMKEYNKKWKAIFEK